MKKTDKKLNLNRQTVRVLTQTTLDQVAGGGPTTHPLCFHPPCTSGSGCNSSVC